jgi:diaminopimelate epimerase
MLLRTHPDYDFEMVYYNSDGAPSTMCGNGGRCIVRFAHALGIDREEYHFLAVDGPHRARLLPEGVSLEMQDVELVKVLEEGAYELNTGSPHYVTFVEDSSTVDVFRRGQAIRQSAPYAAEGINVNFVDCSAAGSLSIATYERGVEGETLACGTGVTAAAIAASLEKGIAPNSPFYWEVKAKGGQLGVRGHFDGQGFRELWLEGPATFVFSGGIALKP